MIRMPLSFQANQLLFAFKDLTMTETASGFMTAVIITALLVGWGLLLFVWTRNRWVGLFPTVLLLFIFKMIDKYRPAVVQTS